MGRYLTKTVFLVVTPILLLHLLISSSCGASVNSNGYENGVSISKGYESEGKLLKSANLELNDLNHGKTCCSASHMQSASSATTYGEASKDCLKLFDNSSYAFEQIIVPFGANEVIISGKASKWESNGTAFCNATGFTVQTAHDSAEEESKASLEPVMESGSREEKIEWFRDLPELIYQAELYEMIFWVESTVITHFIRWFDQQAMIARIQRDARRD